MSRAKVIGNKSNRSRYVEYGADDERYSWDQWEDHLVVTKKFGEGTRGRDIVCEIKKDYIKFGKKGQELLIDGPLYQQIILDESTWVIQEGTVEITLKKSPSKVKEGQIWWPHIVPGGPETNVKDIEAQKFLDDSILEKIYKQKKAQREEAKAERAKKLAEGASPATEETKE
eukprot:TRINITY_DN603_c0_g1_i1.p1 TRINITY_DN603_c0_g1~~TRINITY_DN603_c0_g1_i1.p1  ORF type:complete len:201 (+),score=55.31 TRINITY_DN603_c0_g1_i1:88-603(+)